MNWSMKALVENRITRLICMVAASLSLASLTASRVLAQSTSIPDGIVATGSSSVTVEPSALRLTMSVKAQGTTAKEAIQLLAEHKNASPTSWLK
jgi:uncharacterized protein YggE